MSTNIYKWASSSSFQEKLAIFFFLYVSFCNFRNAFAIRHFLEKIYRISFTKGREHELWMICKWKIKGGIGWNLRNSRIDWDIQEFCLMFLVWEIDIKLCKNYTKTIDVRFCIWFVVLNRSYSTNTQPIKKQRYPRGGWETQICSNYYLNLKIIHF